MTRDEFLVSFSGIEKMQELCDFCRSIGIYDLFFYKVQSKESFEKFVKYQVQHMLNSDRASDDIRDFLNSVPYGFDWYWLYGESTFEEFNTRDFNNKKESILKYLDERGFWENGCFSISYYMPY